MNLSGSLGVLAVLASAFIGTPGCASSPSLSTTTSSHASFDRGKAGSKGAVISNEAAVAEKVRAAFSKLPGTVGFHFMTTSRGAGYRVSQQENKEFFCASTFKVFALAEFLRQAEATPSTVSLTDTIVMSDDQRSFGGKEWGDLLKNGDTVVFEKALDEMIAHSDNTGTDIVLRAVRADKVRALLAGLGLQPVNIPDTTRKMMVELIGFDIDAPDPGWAAIQERFNAADTSGWKNPFVAQQRMATTPAVLANFYSLATKDGFFRTTKSQTKFREILSLPTAGKTISPAGARSYVKGGNLNFLDYNVIGIGGGTVKNDRWIYFGALLNWRASDPATIAATNGAFIGAVTEALKVLAEELPE